MKFLSAAGAVASKVGIKVKKYSPEISMALGIGCFVGAVVASSKATLKAHYILEDHKSKIGEIKAVRENEEFSEEYSDQDYRKDLTTVYAQTGLAFAKNYALTGALILGGTLFVLGSYHILKTRYALVSASYSALSSAFKMYRKRVKEDLGEDKDLKYMYGAKHSKIVEKVTDEKGKEKEVKKEGIIFEGNQYSQYARFFDESCEQWTKNPTYNLDFLINAQRVCNEKLHASISEGGKGFLCLNEVYEFLGIPKTAEGQQVGWVEGNGDGYVDFGIHTGYVANRNFVNGYEPVVLLDFNVDGYILDKI